MKKSILKLGKVLTKKELKNTNGSRSLIKTTCETRCLTAPKGTRCISSIGYLAGCDGSGGFMYY